MGRKLFLKMLTRKTLIVIACLVLVSPLLIWCKNVYSTNAGNALLNKYYQLQAGNDYEEINSIIHLNDDDFKIKGKKKKFDDGYYVELEFFNISDKDIHLFPVDFSVLSKEYEWEDLQWIDIALNFKVINPNFIKILKPGESYQYSLKLPDIVTEKVHLNLTFGNWQFIRDEKADKVLPTSEVIKNLRLE